MQKLAAVAMLLCYLIVLISVPFSSAYVPTRVVSISSSGISGKRLAPLVLKEKRGEDEVEDLEETTRKFGLEVGLWKAFKNKDAKGIKPKDLLTKYGAAYLVTSITLAIISYAICYFLISSGVDVGSLLKKVGIEASSGATNAGTAAVAYAVHKAASPIRFPPTVALTPVVAQWIGKKPVTSEADASDGGSGSGGESNP